MSQRLALAPVAVSDPHLHARYRAAMKNVLRTPSVPALSELLELAPPRSLLAEACLRSVIERDDLDDALRNVALRCLLSYSGEKALLRLRVCQKPIAFEVEAFERIAQGISEVARVYSAIATNRTADEQTVVTAVLALVRNGVEANVERLRRIFLQRLGHRFEKTVALFRKLPEIFRKELRNPFPACRAIFLLLSDRSGDFLPRGKVNAQKRGGRRRSRRANRIRRGWGCLHSRSEFRLYLARELNMFLEISAFGELRSIAKSYPDQEVGIRAAELVLDANLPDGMELLVECLLRARKEWTSLHYGSLLSEQGAPMSVFCRVLREASSSSAQIVAAEKLRNALRTGQAARSEVGEILLVIRDRMFRPGALKTKSALVEVLGEIRSEDATELLIALATKPELIVERKLRIHARDVLCGLGVEVLLPGVRTTGEKRAVKALARAAAKRRSRDFSSSKLGTTVRDAKKLLRQHSKPTAELSRALNFLSALDTEGMLERTRTRLEELQSHTYGGKKSGLSVTLIVGELHFAKEALENKARQRRESFTLLSAIVRDGISFALRHLQTSECMNLVMRSLEKTHSRRCLLSAKAVRHEAVWRKLSLAMAA